MGPTADNLDVLLALPLRRDNHYMVPPLGLGYLATALRNAGLSVDIADTTRDGSTFDTFEMRLARRRPRLLGIQVLSADLRQAEEMIARVRLRFPEMGIVVGGAHITSLPAEAFTQFPEADFAFQGEAELGLPLLARKMLGSGDIPLETIPGLLYRQDGKLFMNPPSLPVDLDALGFPAWDLMDPRSYKAAPQAGFLRYFPFAPISTIRGCPCRCSFCTVHFVSGRKLRSRSADHVIAEMRLLKESYGVREFHIIDDAFTADRDRVLEFCNRLLASGLDIHFTFPNGIRLDTLDETMLRSMKEAGLEYFSAGIESGSDRILKDMRKGLTRKVIEEKIGLAHRLGLTVNGFFIIGYPAETEEDIRATLAFSLRMPLARAQFSLFKAYPGTEITDRLLKSGMIKAVNYDSFMFNRVDVVPAGLTVEKLKRYQRTAFLRFYLRPKILWRILRSIHSAEHLMFLLRRIWASLFVAR